MSFLLHFHKYLQYLSKRTLSNFSNYKEYHEPKNRQIFIIISYHLKINIFLLVYKLLFVSIGNDFSRDE
jgi:hypothetical protein